VTESDGEGIGEAATAQVIALLEQACAALPYPDKNLGLYREFLDANEQGLAFECAVNAAEVQTAGREVWDSLLAAAIVMEIDEDNNPHTQAVQLVRRHFPATP
jgi:hypothetical protein